MRSETLKRQALTWNNAKRRGGLSPVSVSGPVTMEYVAAQVVTNTLTSTGSPPYPIPPNSAQPGGRYREVLALDPVTVNGVPDEYIAASTKSLEASELTEFEQHARSVYKQMVLIWIEPQWARFYCFGAGRVPAFLVNLCNDG
jgi:hypothetical protein